MNGRNGPTNRSCNDNFWMAIWVRCCPHPFPNFDFWDKWIWLSGSSRPIQRLGRHVAASRGCVVGCRWPVSSIYKRKFTVNVQVKKSIMNRSHYWFRVFHFVVHVAYQPKTCGDEDWTKWRKPSDEQVCRIIGYWEPRGDTDLLVLLANGFLPEKIKQIWHVRTPSKYLLRN